MPGWKKDAGLVENAKETGENLETFRREAEDFKTRDTAPTTITNSITAEVAYVTGSTATYAGIANDIEASAGEEIHISIAATVEIENTGGAGGVGEDIELRLVRTNGAAATGSVTRLASAACTNLRATIGDVTGIPISFYAVDTPKAGKVHTYRLIILKNGSNTKARLYSQFWFITKRIARVGK